MADTSSWTSSQIPSDRLAVARVIGAKGLAGAVRLELLTDWPERFDAGSELFVEGEDQPRRVTHVEWGGRVPVVHLEGIGTREAAEALMERYLEVPARPLPEGTYYWHQLEGLRVIDERGVGLGTVVEIFRAGESEVYRVTGPAGELLLPALARVVRRIDLEAGLMVVRPDPEESV
ncbi:MAG: ribosome maturation factor RimM [Candidatus Limnocylindria bacterium]